ncbi:protein NRT1/ PTR FAMILY 4.3 [Selaginella moellendorffii]|nr:protein NRT1/ PTR FAMILY 4.3 [Selaginella moellendorffii]|eukprot:XP_002970257.2 protein NRT1/ PTR FAMILY 4.3 [Selaginella moellendorffii]
MSSVNPNFASQGWKSAPFIFAAIGLENMAFLSVGINLFPYMFTTMHFSITDAANAVTNFMGTSFLLTLLGGFLSDVCLSKFWTISTGAAIASVGFTFLTLSSSIPALRPPPCPLLSPECQEASATGKLVLFLGLYLVAIGSGAVKSNLAALGADQFDSTANSKEKREISTYFNCAFVAFCLGAIVAVTALVYVQDNVSRQCGYAIALGAVLLATIFFVSGRKFYRRTSLGKNPLLSVARVFVAALYNWRVAVPLDSNETIQDEEAGDKVDNYIQRTPQFKFLDRAAVHTKAMTNDTIPWNLCTVTQVEEAKIVLRIIPVFASTIMMNCVLGQLQTFSLAQGKTMDRKVTHKFEIPPASLPFFPLAIMVVLVPIYDRLIVPVIRRATGHEHGITHLQRIGIGLLLAVSSMAIAALVEEKRIRVATASRLLDRPAEIIPMSICWLGLQYVTFGIADMFTFVGLQEFFYSESPAGLKSMATSLAYVSIAIGYFMSSLLVSIVNACTRRKGGEGWLPDNLNRSRLRDFYWLLACLSTANLINYVFWALWYRRGELADRELRNKENQDLEVMSSENQ